MRIVYGGSRKRGAKQKKPNGRADESTNSYFYSVKEGMFEFCMGHHRIRIAGIVLLHEYRFQKATELIGVRSCIQSHLSNERRHSIVSNQPGLSLCKGRVGKKYARHAPLTCSPSSTPTAAPAADQPTRLFDSLTLRSLILPTPRHVAPLGGE